MTADAYQVVAKGTVPHNCFIATFLVTSLAEGTEFPIIDSTAIRFTIVSCEDDTLTIDPDDLVFA